MGQFLFIIYNYLIEEETCYICLPNVMLYLF